MSWTTKHLAIRRSLGLQSYFGLIFIIGSLAIGVSLAVIGYRVLSQGIEKNIEQSIDLSIHDLKRELSDRVRLQAKPVLTLFSVGPVSRADTPEKRRDLLPLFHSGLLAYSLLDSIYIANDSGVQFMAKRLQMPETRQYFNAPEGAGLLVREIHVIGNYTLYEFRFYSHELTLLGHRWEIRGLSRDPRDRTWYKMAMQSEEMIETPPVIFPWTGQPGLVFAQKSPDGKTVVGLSIRIGELTEIMRAQLPTPGSKMVIFHADGNPLASSEGIVIQDHERPRLRPLDQFHPAVLLGREKYMAGTSTRHLRIANGDASTGDDVEIAGERWLLVEEELDATVSPDDFLVLAIPKKEMYANANQFIHMLALGMFGILLFAVPLVWIAARRITMPLRAIAGMAATPYGMGLACSTLQQSHLEEIDALAGIMENLRVFFIDILGIIADVVGERDFGLLTQRVLAKIISMSDADGGTLILMDEKGEYKEDAYYYWKKGNPSTISMRILRGSDPNYNALLAQVWTQPEPLRVSVTREEAREWNKALIPGLSDPAVERIDKLYTTLRSRTRAPLGVLVLYKAIKEGDTSFTTRQTEFGGVLAGVAAVVLEIQSLFKGQRDLRDALIQILAGAIDAKSPYTGGHCARVPALFQMLLQAACDTREGPLADFTLNDDGWEEARLAAWLHDCGKVTTPEYVVDKATKLETLYNRIHEIRTRFEVLKRDAEIASLHAILKGANPAEEEAKLAKALKDLDNDYLFVACANIGGESMEDGDIERLRKIGERTWTRTLDKRLGASREERERMNRAGVPEAPARETLLADGLEYIIERGPTDVISDVNPWGFKLSVPPHLYNRGELYNLAIRRGTLTEEERYKINEHITRTIMMLEAMPLPCNLSRVPEIAGAHHERMDGRGYPRGLAREDMSWSARMMAIADIFEALTASDRPYRSSNTLSEALKIMESFKRNNHIDPDLYELFLKAEIPERYAREFLKPEQNDLSVLDPVA